MGVHERSELQVRRFTNSGTLLYAAVDSVICVNQNTQNCVQRSAVEVQLVVQVLGNQQRGIHSNR
jgi:hypothetical protein